MSDIIDLDVNIKPMRSDFTLRKCLDLTPSTEDDGFCGIPIICPVCGCSYNHAGEVVMHSSDHYRAWSGRGSVLIIPFDGECGHKWSFCIGYHKGENFGFVEIHSKDSNRFNRAFDHIPESREKGI